MNKITRKPFKFGIVLRRTCTFINYSYIDAERWWNKNIRKRNKEVN